MEQTSKPANLPPCSPRQAVKNILRGVDSHVRVMSHLDNVSTSSSYSAVRLKKPKTDSWTEPFNVTRVHRGTSTNSFYQEVIAPCVANCLAGQSYLFLVSGPCESGRSQTLYGSPHHKTKGVVELAAEDLLGYMTGGAENNDDNPSRGQPTVTHSAFVTRGSHINETKTGEPVPIVDFPPPLGRTALPRMQLLESAASVVQIPEHKYSDTSCIIQFQVYVPVDTLGRRSMATLTFVDAAAFHSQPCSEVRHLVSTVRRVAGLSNGDGPSFDQRKLTTLLEPALMGYVTLMSITTISGRDDLHEAACEALRFAETISRIHQVLMLVHINTPKWFLDTAEKVEVLRSQRNKMLSEQHARGVYDYYVTVTKWLSQHVAGAGCTFDKLLEEVEQIREDLACEMKERVKSVQASIQEAEKQHALQLERTRNAHAITTSQLDKVKRLDEAIAALTQKVTQRDLFNDHKISEMRIEISAIESETETRRQELLRFENEERLYGTKCAEVMGVLEKYSADLANSQMHYVLTEEMSAIEEKKKRLEADLATASRIAHMESDNFRANREKNSRLSHLSVMQQKVDSLRGRILTNSVSHTMSRSASHLSPRSQPDASPSESPAQKRRRFASPRYSAV
ncbi:hypothetical protein, conserved [Trypanosoma brucei gambiense DAL972]|uniref:Kinesin motor domain-containing protein n=1 Tax=Trypanosoma brucei gambiense (strain MHOM/CI/86/DAL972) TaxID=679716 RepID=C9ZTE1_TRYB9|nr:hypothetical protein, conserved [Trypanosoma brucei gambiense DAL972]CBH12676.1 hypothetical protein, conserved [Trypanosoma brucei gambiense DAL972]|eukprot:XP_011774956.1 hypothetical protein, conserved [Trypanosoma brucei gambiense DAL972]